MPSSEKQREAWRRKYHRRRQRLGLELDRRKRLLSWEETERLFDAQRGKCAICDDSIALEHRRFAVDHDHQTGKVRGLLCLRCNVGLGHFRDNVTFLKAALNYLAR